MQILLPADFHDEHRRIVLAYLQRGHDFSRREWRQAVIAFDLLKNAFVLVPTGLLPFPVVYRRFVDDQYADTFVEQLLAAETIEPTATRLWREIASRLAPLLAQANLYHAGEPTTRLLLAYCLYWWRSFTQGYALEIEIHRDLTAWGIQFRAHDLRRREERLSPYDIAVLGFKGDIKTSLYFLQAARSRALPHDFYITRMQVRDRPRTLVVFTRAAMWRAIDGDTLLTLLEKLPDVLPQAARIVHQGSELIVIDYAAWKERVRYCQAQEEANESTDDREHFPGGIRARGG